MSSVNDSNHNMCEEKGEIKRGLDRHIFSSQESKSLPVEVSSNTRVEPTVNKNNMNVLSYNEKINQSLSYKQHCIQCFNCRHQLKKMGSYVKQKMAFRSSVTVDPHLYSRGQKRIILIALALGASLNGFCSTVYFPGIPDIKSELKASEIEITLVSSLFILFSGIGPIFWASMSDYYFIRRFLYLVALLVFIGASVGCAVSNKIGLLIVLRCFQSFGTSVTMSVGAGTVSDCWQITERGSAFSVLFVGQFLGPLVGPIIGGGITSKTGWRSVFWICAGYGIFLFLFFFFYFPETYRLNHHWDNEQQKPSELQSQATLINGSSPGIVLTALPPSSSSVSQTVPNSSSSSFIQQNKDNIASYKAVLKEGKILNLSENNSNEEGAYHVIVPSTSTNTIENKNKYDTSNRIFNPFKSFAMLQYIFVCFVAIEIGFCFGTMFTLETLIPDIYYTHYQFNSWQTGLSFLGAGLGNVIGSLVSGQLSDYFLKKSSEKRGGIYKAEDRLTPNTWPGGFFLIPLGVLIFGWSIMAGFSVWPAIIGFSILCFGMSQVYTAGSAYLVDAIPGKGASVTAACNFLRSTMAAILSLISPIMGSALSIGYVSILLTSLNVIGMSLLVYIKFKGIYFRRKAGFAPPKV
ncbi:major facilitator superfamily domain-containing protein [Cokeromyces recurvatus]|uniref:major facilitator superfamily domain-containing protein n=1 Tax=Cokeromyces recurvatus TaxID=90255 RepID=UPI00221ED45A|nr:major facilitator superfamily domain-containing protein [Cokeromyces recurvatus]KAI7903259.1 major facilitator superfamily domain-containing protein [Cokeromyces recurvatus]